MMKPFGVVLVCSSFAAFTAYGAALELDGVCARLAFDGGGRVVSVLEKESGRELASVPFPFVTVKRSGERVLEPVSLAVAPDGARRLLTFGFPGGGTCRLEVTPFAKRTGWNVRTLSCDVADAEELSFARLRLAQALRKGSMSNVVFAEGSPVADGAKFSKLLAALMLK